jgi:hypothetical protein
MNLADLYVGQKVRIICWDEEVEEDGDFHEYRPDHWCDEGGMDEWQGAVVTIKTMQEGSENIYIEEDKEDSGGWQWFPWDFENHCVLPQHDPNIVYKRDAYRRKMDSMKGKWTGAPRGTITGRIRK